MWGRFRTSLPKPVARSIHSKDTGGDTPGFSGSDRNILIKLFCGYLFAGNQPTSLLLHLPLSNQGFYSLPISFVSYQYPFVLGYRLRQPKVSCLNKLKVNSFLVKHILQANMQALLVTTVTAVYQPL